MSEMFRSLGSSNKLKEHKLRQTMIEEFRNWNKKTWIVETTRNKWNKKWNRKRAKYAEWLNGQYLRKVRCKFNNFRTKI